MGRLFASLALVLGLIGLLSVALKRWGAYGMLPRAVKQEARLKVLESIALGPRHRLLLVRRDQVEHLVVLGAEGVTTLETGIAATKPKPRKSKSEESHGA